MTIDPAKLILIVTLALAQGCLASTKEVRMPDGTPATRIECNYDESNCEQKAREVCHGDYRVVRKGSESCENCGLELNGASGPGNNVYKGVLYVRCGS